MYSTQCLKITEANLLPLLWQGEKIWMLKYGTKDIQLFSHTDEIRIWPRLVHGTGVKELIRQHCVELSWWISIRNWMNKEVKIIIKKTEKEGELTHFQLNPRTYTQIYTPPPPHRGTGRDWWNPFPEIWYVLQYFKTILPLVESLFLLNTMRYILWVVAPLEASDVTNNGRHLGPHLGFDQE